MAASASSAPFSPRRTAALLVAVLLACLARPACAALILSWDDCGAGRGTHRTFACDNNAGADTLVVSFVPNFNFPSLAEARISGFVCFRDNTPPDWWQVLGAGSCRLGGLAGATVSPQGGCEPAWDAEGGSTVTLTRIPYTTLNGFTFGLSVTVGDSARARDLVIGHEYALARLVLDHSQTTGPGACAGCSRGAEIAIDFVWFFTTDGRNLGESSGDYVTWQDPTITCLAVVPVVNRTWGSIKSLYR